MSRHDLYASHHSNAPAACDKASNAAYTTLLETLASTSPNTKIIPYPFNVAQEDETLALIDDVLNTWGRLDIWVSSAGLLGPSSLEATTPADLQKCFEVHSMAPFFALKYAPPAMAKTSGKGGYPNAAPKERAYGSIIVVSSVASTYGGKLGFPVPMSGKLEWARGGVERECCPG